VNFSFTPEQKELYDGVVAGVRGALNPLLTKEAGLTKPLWRACGEIGLLGLAVPRSYGGLGLDALSTAIALEAFGYACDDMGLVFSAAAQLLSVSVAIAEHGTEEQKKRYLPSLCRGDFVAGNAMTEAGAGSDAFALATTARKNGDELVISGTKSYVTNGTVADLFLVYARTREGSGPLGVSAVLVERGAPGVRAGASFEKLGLVRSPICSVYFDDCRVPLSQIVGREDRGASVFEQSMTWERACLFAAYLGRGQRLLESTIEHVRTRKQFGATLARNQAVSHRLVDMKLRQEGARLLLYRACALLADGAASPADIALSKLAVSEAAVQSSLDAVQLFGGAGTMEEAGIAVYLRDAVPSTVFSGTSEIQRELVAAALGLHRDTSGGVI
jgi:alkylation response protein AidB-like acyl-CoA dehydrogenase